MANPPPVLPPTTLVIGGCETLYALGEDTTSSNISDRCFKFFYLMMTVADQICEDAGLDELRKLQLMVECAKLTAKYFEDTVHYN